MEEILVEIFVQLIVLAFWLVVMIELFVQLIVLVFWLVVMTENKGPMEVVGQAFLEEVSLYFNNSKGRRLQRRV